MLKSPEGGEFNQPTASNDMPNEHTEMGSDAPTEREEESLIALGLQWVSRAGEQSLKKVVKMRKAEKLNPGEFTVDNGELILRGRMPSSNNMFEYSGFFAQNPSTELIDELKKQGYTQID